MNFSYPFIRRPVGTTLLAIGLFLLGVVAYVLLPVASLPSIDFPTIRVSASRPGADPTTMAATVAAPLERRLARVAAAPDLPSTNPPPPLPPPLPVCLLPPHPRPPPAP